MKRRRSWTDLRPKPTGPRIALAEAEATALARQWYGQHAEVFTPDPPHTESWGVGWWEHAIPIGEAADNADAWPDLHLEGLGATVEAAFRDADKKRWYAYVIRRRRAAPPQSGLTPSGEGE